MNDVLPNKNRVNIRKEEHLLTDREGIDAFDGAYCDGRYLLYVTEDGDGTYKKYDLKKKVCRKFR